MEDVGIRPQMKNHMDQKMEHYVETAFLQVCMRIVGSGSLSNSQYHLQVMFQVSYTVIM